MPGTRSSSGRGKCLMRPLVAGLITALTVLAAACDWPGAPTPKPRETATASAPTNAVTPPDTPAGAQLGWLVVAMAHLPVSEADPRSHFNAGYLATISPDGLNQWLQGLNQWLDAAGGTTNLVSIKVSQPSMVVALVSEGGAGPRARVGLTVDSRGLIGDLDISPATTGSVPQTWAGVDAALRSVAPDVSLLVASVSNGSCQPVHSIEPNAAAPCGSVVKLYVLYALGEAVAAGKVRWDQPLTVTAKVKSLPPGVLQNEPDGTQITALEAATKMITISDNTAADMLINLVGRPAVEKALSTTGMSNPGLNRPLLTTRETFILVLQQWPT